MSVMRMTMRQFVPTVQYRMGKMTAVSSSTQPEADRPAGHTHTADSREGEFTETARLTEYAPGSRSSRPRFMTNGSIIFYESTYSSSRWPLYSIDTFSQRC
jgi:hypothetical protein